MADRNKETSHKRTAFHQTCDKIVEALDGSRKVFSNLVDLFSAIAYRDFTNDWAPDLAERCFRFNKAQKKLQHDFREWADSITERDLEMVSLLFGLRSGASRGYAQEQPGEGGDPYRDFKKKASAQDRESKERRKFEAVKGKAARGNRK
jgi:hypothetical protein